MPQVKCTNYSNIHCRQVWHELETIDPIKRIKHCDKCLKNVHWCGTPDEVVSALGEGRCIASHNKTLEEAGVWSVPEDGSQVFVGGHSSGYEPTKRDE